MKMPSNAHNKLRVAFAKDDDSLWRDLRNSSWFVHFLQGFADKSRNIVQRNLFNNVALR